LVVDLRVGNRRRRFWHYEKGREVEIVNSIKLSKY